VNIVGFLRFVLAFANGALLCAAITLAWNSASPFHGGGPNLIGLLGTASLVACFLGAGLASLLNQPLLQQRPQQSPRLLALSLLWMSAGLFLIAATPLYPRVLELFERYGLLTAVAVGFIALFLPAIALLCTTLLLRTNKSLHSSAPEVSSPLPAAILGAAGTFGYLLWAGLPWLGVARWTTISGITALCLGTVLLTLAIRSRFRRSAIVALLLLVSGAAWLSPHPGPHRDGLRALAHTGSEEIRILDNGGYRYMLVDGEPRLAVDPATNDAKAPDPSTLELMLQFFWPPGRALLIGAPEPAFVHALAQRGWEVDVAAQPLLLSLSREYLGLDATEYQLIPTNDLLADLLADPNDSTADTLYQIIVVQTRGSSTKVHPFATRSGIASLQRRMHPDGVLLFRALAPGWEHPWPRSRAAPRMMQFREVWVLPVTGGPRNVSSLVLAASERYLEIGNHFLPTPQDHPNHPEAQLQSSRARNAWRYRFVPDTEQTQILQLAHNPVPYWMQSFHTLERQRLHRRLGGRTLTW
jgi:hypothetical protein